MTQYDELVRSLLVERFSRWQPRPSINDRSELASNPAVGDGLPFEPINQNPRHGRISSSRNTTRRSR